MRYFFILIEYYILFAEASSLFYKLYYCIFLNFKVLTVVTHNYQIEPSKRK